MRYLLIFFIVFLSCNFLQGISDIEIGPTEASPLLSTVSSHPINEDKDIVVTIKPCSNKDICLGGSYVLCLSLMLIATTIIEFIVLVK